MRTRIRASVLIIAVGIMAFSAACAGGGGAAEETTAATTAPATSTQTTTAETATTSTTPVVDPEVERWRKPWQRKIATPMRKAAATLAAIAVPALEGNSTANYRLTGASNKLLQCRTTFEYETSLMENTPNSLTDARKLTLQACRLFFVGAETIFKGFGAQQDRSLVDKGLALVKKGTKLLAKAEKAAEQAQ